MAIRLKREIVVKKRLMKFTEPDEEALQKIQSSMRVSASGAVRFALRMTQILMQAVPGKDAAALRDEFIDSLKGMKFHPRAEFYKRENPGYVNKHLRITQQDDRTKNIALQNPDRD